MGAIIILLGICVLAIDMALYVKFIDINVELKQALLIRTTTKKLH